MLVLLIFIPLGVKSQPTALRDYFESARNFDPIYAAALAAHEGARQATAVANSMLGPKVSLSLSAFGTNRVEESRTILGGSSDVSRTFNAQNAVIQARQPLYRKRESLGVEQALAQESAADQSLRYAEQDLQLRLVSAWIEVLASRRLSATFSEAVSASREHLEEVQRRQSLGEATVQELEQARARALQTEALFEDARARLAVADQALSLIVGSDQKLSSASSMLMFSSLPIPFQSELEVIDSVERSNFEVSSARQQEEAARIEREKARSDRLPTVDAIASVTKGQNDSLSFIKDEQRLGVQLSVPIYTHGSIDATIAQAEANYRRLQAQARSTTFRARSEAVTAFNNLRAMEIRLRASDRLFEAAATLVKAQQRSLSAGLVSRGELAQSRADLLAAQRDRILVRRDYVAAWLKLQIATGTMDLKAIDALQGRLSAPD